jgi:hypothetical protein
MHIQSSLPSSESIQRALVELKDLPKSSLQQPDWILAIDGSHLEGQPEKGYPGAEYGVVTIASVLIDLKKIAKLEKKDFIDPKSFRETEKASSQESLFPGSNIVIDKEKDAKSSLRRMIFEELKGTKIFSDGETLLDTYEHLFRIKRSKFPKEHLPRNPIDEEYELTYDEGEYECPHTHERLFSTDALRLHELMNPNGTNGELFGQLMSTLEKLWLVNILRWFETSKNITTLRRVAFFSDGPLAVFSTSSWLTKVIEDELRRINEIQKKVNGEDMLILGLEKSGSFFNHFVDIDTSKEGTTDIFPRQSAFLLADNYIKSNIIYSESTKIYGLDTYFGRKFFYKTASGQKLVPVLAWFNDYQKDLRTANPDQFTRLRDVLELLDSLVSNRYPNSIFPIISAHAEAAIPLNLGKRLFEDIAREIAASSSRVGA